MTARDARLLESISALVSCYDTETEPAVTRIRFESEKSPVRVRTISQSRC